MHGAATSMLIRSSKATVSGVLPRCLRTALVGILITFCSGSIGYSSATPGHSSSCSPSPTFNVNNMEGALSMPSSAFHNAQFPPGTLEFLPPAVTPTASATTFSKDDPLNGPQIHAPDLFVGKVLGDLSCNVRDAAGNCVTLPTDLAGLSTISSHDAAHLPVLPPDYLELRKDRLFAPSGSDSSAHNGLPSSNSHHERGNSHTDSNRGRLLAVSPSVSISTSVSGSVTASVSTSYSRSISDTGSGSGSRTTTASGTSSTSITATVTVSTSLTPSGTISGSQTSSNTLTPSTSPSYTQTGSWTASNTHTGTITASDSVTLTTTPTSTRSMSWTSSVSSSVTASSTMTRTMTASQTPSQSGTWTSSLSPSATLTSTGTRTVTASETSTQSGTWTSTPTPTSTLSVTATLTVTSTQTPSRTMSWTPSVSQTATVTVSSTVTLTASHTATVSMTPSPYPFNAQPYLSYQPSALTGVTSPFSGLACVEKPLFQVDYQADPTAGMAVIDPEGDALRSPVYLYIDTNCPWWLNPNPARFSFNISIDAMHPANPGLSVTWQWIPSNCTLALNWNMASLTLTAALLRSYFVATRVQFCDAVNEFGAKLTSAGMIQAPMTFVLAIDDVPVVNTRKSVASGSNLISIGTASQPALLYTVASNLNIPAISGHVEGLVRAYVNESTYAPSALYPQLSLVPSSTIVPQEEITSATVWIDNCWYSDTLYIPAGIRSAFTASTLFGSARASVTSNPQGFPACSVRIVGPASALNYSNILSAVRLNISSDNPCAANRKLIFGLSTNNNFAPYDASPSMYIAVAAVNDPPVVYKSPALIMIRENYNECSQVLISPNCSLVTMNWNASGYVACIEDPDPMVVSQGSSNSTYHDLTVGTIVHTAAGSRAPTVRLSSVFVDCPTGTLPPSNRVLPSLSCLVTAVCGFPMDFEDATTPRNFSVVINIADYFSVTPTVVNKASLSLNYTMVDLDDAPSIVLLQPRVSFDETNGAATGQTRSLENGTTLIVVDPDATYAGSVSFNVSCAGLDGTAALSFLRCQDIFTVLCTQNTTSISNSTQSRFELVLNPLVDLQLVPRKSFQISIFATEASWGLLASNTVSIPVEIIRHNKPVDMSGIGSVNGGGVRTLAINVNENSAPGTVVASISASDADANQALTYTVVSNDSRIASVFDVRPTFVTYQNRLLPRGIEFFVNLDALDYEDGQRQYSFVMLVADDAQFNNTELPAVNTTWALLTVNITIVDVPDKPLITGFSNMPENGLSSGGLQTIILTGSNLGLPFGPASSVSAYYSNGATNYNFTSCVVVTRWTAISCVTSAGQGYNHHVTVRVGSQWSALSVPTISYQIPLIQQVVFPQDGMPSTGGVFDLTGTNFPSTTQELVDSVELRVGDAMSTIAANCSVVSPQTHLRCIVETGVGAHQGLYMNASGVIITPSTMNFALPTIEQVIQESFPTEGGVLVTIIGTNFGLRSLDALDWVRAMIFGCSETTSGWSIYANTSMGSCDMVLATSCHVVTDHTTIECLAGPGYGGPFRWQVSVAGSVSAWSNVTTYYDPPSILSVIPVEAATYTPTSWYDLSGNSSGYYIPSVGKTLLRILGSNFPLSETGMIVHIGSRTFMYPELHVANASTAMVIAPPGYGSANITVVVGSNNATLPVKYTPLNITGIEWSAGDMASAVRSIKVYGSGFSLCSFCVNSAATLEACAQAATTLSECASTPTSVSDFEISIDGEAGSINDVSADSTMLVFSTRSLVGAGSLTMGNERVQFDYNFTQLVQSQPMIRELNPSSGWLSKGGQLVTLTIDNAGSYGSVYVDTEAGSWQCPPAWDSLISPLSGATVTSTLFPAYTVSDVARFQTPDGAQYLNVGDAGDMALAKQYAANYSSSFIWLYEQQDNAWLPRRTTQVACYMVSWRGSGIGKGHDIKFISPAWHGTVTIRVNAAGRSSINALSASYALPVVSMVTPNKGATQAQMITLAGSGFGVSQRLLDLWLDKWDAVFHLSTLNNASALMSYSNSVRFYYVGLSDAGRICRVLSWSDSEVRCVAPEGVPETLHNIIVTLSHGGDAGTSTANELSLFTYGSARISSVSPSTGPTVGLYEVTLQGQNFGRLPVSSGLFNPLNQSITTTWNGSVYEVPFTDASADGRWRTQISIRSVTQSSVIQGLISGLQDSAQLQIEIVSHSHSSISFIIPPFEGQVAVSLIFVSQAGTKITTVNDVVIRADPPVITSISAPNEAGIFNADPCSALVERSLNDACLAEAWGVNPWPEFVVSATRPCVRAVNAPSSPLRIKISGYNFGSGVLAPSALLGNITCGPLDDRLGTIFVDNTTLLCAVKQDMLDTPMDLTLGIAFSNTSSSASDIVVASSCPCGYYSEGPGFPCKACVAGASCRGVGDKPRALAGHWETIAAEWQEERNIVPSSSVPQFVSCAVPSLCMSDRTCRNGSTGWMCVDCMEGTARGYDQTCDLCPYDATTGVQAGLPIAFVLLLVAGAAVRARLVKNPGVLRRKSLFRQHTPESRQLAAGKPTTIAMLKMCITYIQTLGILSQYTKWQDGALPSTGLVPSFLRQLQFGTDFGASSHTLQCAFAIPFYWKQWMAVSMPMAAILLAPSIAYLYALLSRTVLARCKFFLHDDYSGSRSKVFAGSAGAIATLLVLPLAITAAARLQLCASDNAGYYLIAEPSISCSHTEYETLATSAFILGYVYMLFPILVGAMLFYKVTSVTIYLEFFLNGYDVDSNRRWPRAWESIVLLRKALLTSISTGFLGLQDVRSQLLLSMMLLSLSFAWHISVFPYKARSTNILEANALLGEITFGFAMMTRLASSNESAVPDTESLSFDIVAVVLNAPFALAYIFFLADHCMGYRMTARLGQQSQRFLRINSPKKGPMGAGRPMPGGSSDSIVGLEQFLAEQSPEGRQAAIQRLFPELAPTAATRLSIFLQQGNALLQPAGHAPQPTVVDKPVQLAVRPPRTSIAATLQATANRAPARASIVPPLSLQPPAHGPARTSMAQLLNPGPRASMAPGHMRSLLTRAPVNETGDDNSSGSPPVFMFNNALAVARDAKATPLAAPVADPPPSMSTTGSRARSLLSAFYGKSTAQPAAVMKSNPMKTSMAPTPTRVSDDWSAPRASGGPTPLRKSVVAKTKDVTPAQPAAARVVRMVFNDGADQQRGHVDPVTPTGGDSPESLRTSSFSGSLLQSAGVPDSIPGAVAVTVANPIVASNRVIDVKETPQPSTAANTVSSTSTTARKARQSVFATAMSPGASQAAPIDGAAAGKMFASPVFARKPSAGRPGTPSR